MHYPLNLIKKLPPEATTVGAYPVALIPGQYQDHYKPWVLCVCFLLHFNWSWLCGQHDESCARTLFNSKNKWAQSKNDHTKKRKKIIDFIMLSSTMNNLQLNHKQFSFMSRLLHKNTGSRLQQFQLQRTPGYKEPFFFASNWLTPMLKKFNCYKQFPLHFVGLIYHQRHLWHFWQTLWRKKWVCNHFGYLSVRHHWYNVKLRLWR